MMTRYCSSFSSFGAPSVQGVNRSNAPRMNIKGSVHGRLGKRVESGGLCAYCSSLLCKVSTFKTSSYDRFRPSVFPRRLRHEMSVMAAANGFPEEGRVVILGGTGRVGSSTAVALIKKCPQLEIVVGSRNEASYRKAQKKRPLLSKAKFEKVDIDSLESLKQIMRDTRLVIHTAGPFQRKEGSLVLEAAIATKTPYVDVCDDADYAQMLKGYGEEAIKAGIPAITSAAHMISIARREYDSEWRMKIHSGKSESENGEMPAPLRGEPVEPLRVRYTYYTAGSGGVGPTILETSFLLAGTDVVVYRDGKKELLEPVTEKRIVDFGKGIGEKPAWLYNLPEVYSTYKYMKVPSVSARFGTDPAIWNWAMIAVARFLPKSFLADRDKIKFFAKLSMPWVSLVDPISGEKVGMMVEVDLADGTTAAARFTHKYLNESVGICMAAFVKAMLNGSTKPGVWFPEEPEAIANRRELLVDAAEGTLAFDINKPLWQLGSDPRQIGMGLYF